MILGVGPGPAVSVPRKVRVQTDVNLEIRTESSHTGYPALRQSWHIILEPPEDEPDLPVPVVSRPAVVLPQLLVALSLLGLRMAEQLQVIWPSLQGNTETNQQGVARVQTFQSYLEPSEQITDIQLICDK